MIKVMETEANAKLRKAGHAGDDSEELLAGRLYTGPMYMKFNAVLRAKSKMRLPRAASGCTCAKETTTRRVSTPSTHAC